MPELPAEAVTFLLTDVEGSTGLWESEPEAMREALVRHDAIVAEAVRSHGGAMVKPRGEGDSAFCVFDGPNDASHAALAIQRALGAESWPTSRPLLVRMAIHTGPADLRDNDYYGPTVNRSARLRAIGHGGQVLLSGAARDLVADGLPAGVSLADLGSHRLKDLAHPEHVWQLCHPDSRRSSRLSHPSIHDATTSRSC
jgi:class 3 adenylate cyclase